MGVLSAAGPPLAVSEAEVPSLYGTRYQISVLKGPLNVLHEQPEFAERGVSQLEASALLLKPR